MTLPGDQPVHRIPLLVLPGSLGLVEGMETLLAALSEDRHVIVFDYDVRGDFGDLLDAADAATTAAGSNRFDVLGFSFGGWVAQCLAAAKPHRVRRLVIAHGFVLNASHRWRFALATRVWDFVPQSWLRAILLKRSRVTAAALEAAYPAIAVKLERSIREKSLDRDVLLGLSRQQHWLKQSLATGSPWLNSSADRELLIIDSDNDPLLRENDRQALRDSYRRAQLHRFRGTGHSSALAEPHEFARLVEEYLM